MEIGVLVVQVASGATKMGGWLERGQKNGIKCCYFLPPANRHTSIWSITNVIVHQAVLPWVSCR